MTMGVYDGVPCPYCFARKGFACRKTDGSYAQAPHQARVRSYERQNRNIVYVLTLEWDEKVEVRVFSARHRAVQWLRDDWERAHSGDLPEDVPTDDDEFLAYLHTESVEFELTPAALDEGLAL